MSENSSSDEGMFKRIGVAAIVALGLALGSGWGLAWLLGAKLDPKAWTIFINAKLPLIWTQATTVLLTIYFVDFATPGRTIATILNLEGDRDTPENRRTAAYLLLGLGAVVAYSVKGGF